MMGAGTVKCCQTCLYQKGKLFTYSDYCAKRAHKPYWVKRGRYWVPSTIEGELI